MKAAVAYRTPVRSRTRPARLRCQRSARWQVPRARGGLARARGALQMSMASPDVQRSRRAWRPGAGGAGGRLAALPGLGARQRAEPGRPRARRARRPRVRPGARAARALPRGARPRLTRRAARPGDHSAMPRPGLLLSSTARPARCTAPPPASFTPLRLQSISLPIYIWLPPRPRPTSGAPTKTCAPRAPGLVRLRALAQRGGRQWPRGGRGGAGARAAGGRPGAVLGPLLAGLLVPLSSICACVAQAAARSPRPAAAGAPWAWCTLCFLRKGGAGRARNTGTGAPPSGHLQRTAHLGGRPGAHRAPAGAALSSGGVE